MLEQFDNGKFLKHLREDEFQLKSDIPLYQLVRTESQTSFRSNASEKTRIETRRQFLRTREIIKEEDKNLPSGPEIFNEVQKYTNFLFDID